MSKTVAQIEADLAAAKQIEAQEQALAQEKARLTADRQRRIDALKAEAANESASIDHLKGKISVRESNIAALQKRISAVEAEA